MVILLWILMAVVPALLGNGAIRCLYGKRYQDFFGLGEILPVGFCVVIGGTEAAHLMTVFLGWSVSRVSLLWGGMMVILLVASVILLWAVPGGRKTVSGRGAAESGKCFRDVVARGAGRHEAGTVKMTDQLLAGAFALSVMFQVIVIMTGDWSCDSGDMTLEMVRTFLAKDQVYGVNPLTGQAYAAGVPLRLRILCLPSLYAFICRLTGLDAELVVCRMVPVAVLFGSYFAYSILAKVLFEKDRTGRFVMMLVISVLYWCGDYPDAMDGFLLLHGGYRGLAIRNGILIPFALGMCLQRKWKAAVLAVLAEACIVWTLYGLGACLLVVVVMFFIDLWIRARERRGGEACGNS